MDDENAEDEPAETPEDDWKRNTFYVSVDTIINSLKNRFEIKTVHDLQACLNTFCKMHNIDAFCCAEEVFNFARSFNVVLVLNC